VKENDGGGNWGPDYEKDQGCPSIAQSRNRARRHIIGLKEESVCQTPGSCFDWKFIGLEKDRRKLDQGGESESAPPFLSL